MTNNKKFSMEVILTNRFSWKVDFWDLLTFGISSLPKMMELYGKYMIEVDQLGDVYCVKYIKGQEQKRWKLAITFEELKAMLPKKKYKDERYCYTFLMRTAQYWGNDQ